MNDMSSIQTAVALQEIRAGLARENLTQEQLAQHIGLSRTGVYRRLNGDTAFTVDELTATAECINVPLASLLTPQAPAGSPLTREPAGASSLPSERRTA